MKAMRRKRNMLRRKYAGGLLLAVLLILIADSSMALAEHRVKIKAGIRYRWEYQDRFNQKYYGADPPEGKTDNGFLLQRARFVIGFQPHGDIYLSAGLQDSRAYNLALADRAFYNPRLGLYHNPDKDYLEPFDTYLELKNLFACRLSLKAGRQIIAYGDKRIFGPGEWGNTGRYIWDAVKVSYRSGKNFIDAFYGKNIIHDPEKLTLGHRHFFGCLAIYSHFRLPVKEKVLCLEPFLIRKFDNHDNFRGENLRLGDFASNYYGLRTYSSPFPGLDYDLTFVWQSGHWAQDDLDAYGYHVMAGYRPAGMPWKPRASVEFSYASGDRNPADGKRGTFDGVFGARDKMYGRMNLMDWKNLQDAQVNLEFKPGNRLGFKAELHKFWLAEARDAWYLNQKFYRDKSGRYGKDLGWELDIVGKYPTPLRGLDVQFGYGHFWPGRFVRKMADNSEANWCFLQLYYRFAGACL